MELSIAQPDDWHLHLRDGELLEAVVSHRLFEHHLVLFRLDDLQFVIEYFCNLRLIVSLIIVIYIVQNNLEGQLLCRI